MEVHITKTTNRAKLLKYLLENNYLEHGKACDMFCLAPGSEIRKMNESYKKETQTLFDPIRNVGSTDGADREWNGTKVRYSIWMIPAYDRERILSFAKTHKWI